MLPRAPCYSAGVMLRFTLLFGLLAGSLLSQDGPITALPYTPAIEPAFLDKSADPCVDFYRFACGKWNGLNPIPSDQSRWNVYGKLQVENLRLLWGILQEAAKPSPARGPLDQKVGDYFAACMDEGAIEKAGAHPLDNNLAAIAALKKTSEIAPLLGRLHLELQSSVLFDFGPSQDYADSNRMIAFASQAASVCRTAITT